MLFDYLAFMEELRYHENPQKRKIVERWDKISKAKSIEEEPFYEYLKKFEVEKIAYNVPIEVMEDFDWKLLIQLVAGSFSSNYYLKYSDPDKIQKSILETELPELFISVQSGGVSVTKTISELFSFQILRLYEIYIEEQINLHMLKLEDKAESNTIELERKIRLKTFNKWVNQNVKYLNGINQKIIRQKILGEIDAD